MSCNLTDARVCLQAKAAVGNYLLATGNVAYFLICHLTAKHRHIEACGGGGGGGVSQVTHRGLLSAIVCVCLCVCVSTLKAHTPLPINNL